MIVFCIFILSIVAFKHNFQHLGAIPYLDTPTVAIFNSRVWNLFLPKLKEGDIFVVPNATFYINGGLDVKDLVGVTIVLNGVLAFSENINEWPRGERHYLPCMNFANVTNFTLTSDTEGVLDGRGAVWWEPQNLVFDLNIRPRLFEIAGRDVLIERIFFKNSPFWTFYSHAKGLEVRYCRVEARHDSDAIDDGHSLYDLTAFNTDGFDVSGQDVYIHDVSIYCQDDCIAVKADEHWGDEHPVANMLFERVNCSGLGLSIGSIGAHRVENITFRDSIINKGVKGIYLKFNDHAESEMGQIRNVLFEDIVMYEPSQWPIWIGPAQQSDTLDVCAAHPCSLCWPQNPNAECRAVGLGLFQNITLRHISVHDSEYSPGVLLASPMMPMRDIFFDDVNFHGYSSSPFDNYLCENVDLQVRDSYPVPGCATETDFHHERRSFTDDVPWWVIGVSISCIAFCGCTICIQCSERAYLFALAVWYQYNAIQIWNETERMPINIYDGDSYSSGVDTMQGSPSI